MLDTKLRWRHNGATPSHKKIIVDSLDRINLRLTPEMFRTIDAVRSRRPGNVSRNTWIAEAINEKLARESNQPDLAATQQVVNG